MIARNSKVKIVASSQLTEMMLEEFPYQEEYEWFIPAESVCHA